MSVRGDLKSMPVTDLFQFIEMNNKTGVLVLAQKRIEKCFCFQDGRIIFVSSKKKGERLGEFLAKTGNVDEDKMKEALFKSSKENVPFTRCLIDDRVVPKEFLMVAIEELAEIMFTDILDWETGKFEFIDGLPELVVNGPVHINTSYLIFESVRKHDEKLKGGSVQ